MSEDDLDAERAVPKVSEPASSDELTNMRSFEDMASDTGLTEEDLRIELARYTKALQSEYESKLEEKPENIEEYTTEFFKKNVASAAAQIVWLANNAESETVRGNMSKFIVQAAQTQENADKDPIKDLLNSLTKNDKKPQPTSKES